MSEDTPKHRLPNPSLVVFSEARALVAPTQDKLERWYEEAATLRASLALRTGNSKAVRARALELLPSVTAERIELDARTTTASVAAANHSLVRDVAKALVRLRTDLEEMANAI